MERKNKIRLYSFILASVIGITSLSGCNKKKNEESEPVKYVFSRDIASYNFDNYVDFKIEDGNAVCYYKGENIYLAINKETNEITEYICDYGWSSFFEREILDAYEIPSGDMIITKSAANDGLTYYNYLKETCDFIGFIDIGSYVEGETCKEWYTLDEIKEFEPLILDGHLKIRDLKEELGITK